MYSLKYGQYINIQSFMIIDYGLTGNDLLVYAIIWGFSQDGENKFMGNRSYLAAWCNSSERAISRNIRNLLDMGLIEQVYKSADCRDVYYRATDTRDKLSGVTICQGTGDKMSGVPVTKCQGARDKMSGVYIDNIKDTLKDNIKESITGCETQPRPRFQKPTIEAVKAYAERNGKKVVISAESFFNYYEANGWKVGKNPMKDWRAAFRMWEAREKKDGAPSGSRARKPEDIPTLNETEPEEMTGVWDGVTMPLSDAQVNLLSSSERQRYFEARMDWIIKEK